MKHLYAVMSYTQSICAPRQNSALVFLRVVHILTVPSHGLQAGWTRLDELTDNEHWLLREPHCERPSTQLAPEAPAHGSTKMYKKHAT